MIKEDLLARGYEPDFTIFKPDSELMETLGELKQSKIATTKYQINKMQKKEALKDAKLFLTHYFQLYRVMYEKELKIGSKGLSFIRPKNPFSLPIHFVEENIFYGATIESNFNFKKFIAFQRIELSSIITEQTPITYAHEIIHTQVDEKKGTVQKYYHSEVLSIFIELIYSYLFSSDERLLRLEDLRRISEMFALAYELTNSTDFETQIINTSYLVSELKAYRLFMLYYYGSTSLKKGILAEVQKVIDGSITLEEMLYGYNITLESSKEKQKMMTYFKR